MQIIWKTLQRWFRAPIGQPPACELPPMTLRELADLPPSHPACDCGPR